MTETGRSRRAAIGAGGVGVAGGLIAAAAGLIEPKKANEAVENKSTNDE
jgi:hypothetical protein